MGCCMLAWGCCNQIERPHLNLDDLEQIQRWALTSLNLPQGKLMQTGEEREGLLSSPATRF